MELETLRKKNDVEKTVESIILSLADLTSCVEEGDYENIDVCSQEIADSLPRLLSILGIYAVQYDDSDNHVVDIYQSREDANSAIEDEIVEMRDEIGGRVNGDSNEIVFYPDDPYSGESVWRKWY